MDHQIETQKFCYAPTLDFQLCRRHTFSFHGSPILRSNPPHLRSLLSPSDDGAVRAKFMLCSSPGNPAIGPTPAMPTTATSKASLRTHSLPLPFRPLLISTRSPAPVTLSQPRPSWRCTPRCHRRTATCALIACGIQDSLPMCTHNFADPLTAVAVPGVSIR